MKSFQGDLFSVGLTVDQKDLITCLLLDRLVGLSTSDLEVNPIHEAYADLLQRAKLGLSIDQSRFFKEMEALRALVGNDSHYLPIIDTIIALWNS